jgi:hypothetical protein
MTQPEQTVCHAEVMIGQQPRMSMLPKPSHCHVCLVSNPPQMLQIVPDSLYL